MGKENRMLLMNKKQKKEFLEKIAEMERKYSKIKVTTEDPLKFSLKNCPWGYGNFNITREGFYGGCTAGVAGFNVDCKGVITPCAVLLKKITNLNKYSIKDAKKKYVSSNIIKNLFKRNLKGKCGICELKKLCGGCRAVAEGINKDYLGEDTTCFYKRD
jgi:radical SAM protein with 4Fe4S-binding SPASM domain